MTHTTHTQPNAAARLAPNRAMQGCLGRTRCVLSFAHPATMHSRAVLFLTMCSDDSKPHMILKALDESYKNHIGFAIIRAHGEEYVAADSPEQRRILKSVCT